MANEEPFPGGCPSPASIHRRAHAALAWMTGTVSMADISRSRSRESAMYVSSRSEYISEWMFSMKTWHP